MPVLLVRATATRSALSRQEGIFLSERDKEENMAHRDDLACRGMFHSKNIMVEHADGSPLSASCWF